MARFVGMGQTLERGDMIPIMIFKFATVAFVMVVIGGPGDNGLLGLPNLVWLNISSRVENHWIDIGDNTKNRDFSMETR